MRTSTSVPSKTAISLRFHALRTVTSPEDQAANRKRYCGVAFADQLLKLPTYEDVRAYLGRDHEGSKRKSTLVNKAIRATLEENRDLFPDLNAGIVIAARTCEVDDKSKSIRLHGASIVNGAQTQGVLRDYFEENPEDTDFPSVNFELLVTDDEALIGDISIARNFQNRVEALSIYGRQKLFDELEAAMQEHDPNIRLRKAETDFDPSQIDTEKLIQVITAICPRHVPLPSAEKRKVKTPETIYRVYAYRHRSRCLKDFATVMEEPAAWPEAHRFFLDLGSDAWSLYKRFRGEQFFSRLHKVGGRVKGGRKIVASDGVPDGIVFPMLSAFSRFTEKTRSGWRLKVPKSFPWETLLTNVEVQFKDTAQHNPQTMGKSAGCYISLHGLIDMFSASAKA